MQLKFTIKNQRIARTDSEKPVAGSVGYLTALFTFSADWDGLVKTAIFRAGTDTPYEVLIADDGTCEVATQAIVAGTMFVSVRGDSATGVTVFLPTAANAVQIYPAGAVSGETPEDPTPDVYATMLNSMKEPYIGENNNWWVWDVETLAFVDSGTPSNIKGDTGNVMYATFDYDPLTGEIVMTTPDGYTGPTFLINDDGMMTVEVA